MRIAREGGDVPNDQHGTQRILSDLRAHELEGEINIGGLLILGPFVQVACCEDNVVQEPSALSKVGLEPRLVQVLGAGLHNILLIIFDAGKVLLIDQKDRRTQYLRPVQLPQLDEAELQVAGLVLIKRLADR